MAGKGGREGGREGEREGGRERRGEGGREREREKSGAKREGERMLSYFIHFGSHSLGLYATQQVSFKPCDHKCLLCIL